MNSLPGNKPDNTLYRTLIHPLLSLLSPFAFVLAFTGILQDAVPEIIFINLPQYGILFLSGIASLGIRNIFKKERLSKIHILREFVLTGALLYLCFSLFSEGTLFSRFTPHTANIYPLIAGMIQWGIILKAHSLFHKRELFLETIKGHQGEELKRALNRAATLSVETYYELEEYNKLSFIPGCLLFVCLLLFPASDSKVSLKSLLAVGFYLFTVFLSEALVRIFLREYRHMGEGIPPSPARQKKRIFSALLLIFFLLLLASQLASHGPWLPFPEIRLPKLPLPPQPTPDINLQNLLDLSPEEFNRERILPPEVLWFIDFINSLFKSLLIITGVLFLILPFLSKDFRNYLKKKSLFHFLKERTAYLRKIIASFFKDFLFFLKKMAPTASEKKRVQQAAAQRTSLSASSYPQKKEKEVSRFIKLYLKVIRWGGRQGIPCFKDQTPKEYTTEILHRFPEKRDSLLLVTELTEQALFSPRLPSKEELKELNRQVRRIVTGK